MSHLQNKPLPYQQIQTRSRDCAVTRSRYKIMEKKAEPQLFYSDEDDSKSHRHKSEFEDIIKKAEGQFQRTQVKEEAYSPSKSKRIRPQNKKKSTKPKIHQATPLNNTPEMPHASIAPIPEEQNEINELAQADQPQTQAILPPKQYHNNQVSFQTPQQTKLNRMEGMKNLVEKKFASNNNIKRKPFLKNQIPFHFVPDYRAYFEKQTHHSYEDYQAKMNVAVENAITSKVNQLLKLQKETKHQLLKRIQDHRFKIRKNTARIIETIADVSNSIQEGQPVDKSIINAAYASNLNHDFSHINQFLASHHNLINEHQSQNNQSQKTPIHALNFAYSSEIVENEQNKGAGREKKRKEKPKIEVVSERMTEEQPNKSQIRQPIKPADILYTQKDNAKVFEIISRVNQECAQDEKIRRIECQQLQRERQERQRSKAAKKEQSSNISSHEPAKSERFQDNQSEKRRIQNIQNNNWINFQKTNPKIKRLQILNRYHYNPFEENEGEDQCQLWKKLMSMEIKNIKSEHLSIKNEDNHNPTLIEDLYRQAEENDKNIFEMATNYKPSGMDQKNKQQEQALVAIQQKERQAKQKKSKKQKKIHKSKKDKKEKESRSGHENRTSENNEPEIDDFLNLGPKFEQEQLYQQPVTAKLEYMGNYSQTSKQAGAKNNFSQTGQQSNQQYTPAFNYDQLPDLQGFENIKQDYKPYDDEPLFYNEAEEYRDIEYYEGLASKHK